MSKQQTKKKNSAPATESQAPELPSFFKCNSFLLEHQKSSGKGMLLAAAQSNENAYDGVFSEQMLLELQENPDQSLAEVLQSIDELTIRTLDPEQPHGGG